MQAAVESGGSGEEKGLLSLMARGIVRGLVVWVVYVVALTLLGSASALILIFTSDLDPHHEYPVWRLGSALLLALGAPALGFLLGQKGAIATAIARVARGKARSFAAWMTERAFPVCVAVAETRGASTVTEMTNRLLTRLALDELRGMRLWFMRRLLIALRVPELCSAASFLTKVRESPEDARGQLEATTEERMIALSTIHPYRALVPASLGVLAVAGITSLLHV
jgi:hypothetical protein